MKTLLEWKLYSPGYAGNSILFFTEKGLLLRI